MAKRLNRFENKEEIKPIKEEKENIIENGEFPVEKLDNTAELPVLNKEEVLKEEIDDISLEEEPDYVVQSKSMHLKSVAIFFLSILVIGSLALAGYIVLKPEEKKPTIQASSYATPISYSDEDKQKMLDSINNYLSGIYGTEYSIPSIEEFNPSVNGDSAVITDFRVTLTTADNSPTLVTRFTLSYNEELGIFNVDEYVIESTEYPVSEENSNISEN